MRIVIQMAALTIFALASNLAMCPFSNEQQEPGAQPPTEPPTKPPPAQPTQDEFNCPDPFDSDVDCNPPQSDAGAEKPCDDGHHYAYSCRPLFDLVEHVLHRGVAQNLPRRRPGL